MTIEIKAIVKSHVTIHPENHSAEVSLVKVQDGEWELARKAEYKRDVYAIPDTDVFLEVCFARSGTYHSGYTFDKPKFSLVEKTSKNVVSYPAIPSLTGQISHLKETHFDNNDETKLIPIYESGWVYAHKASIFESVYDIGGILFKQTLYGNSDWTDLVEYAVVDKIEETLVSYKKIK